jgi:hypothetical protein
MCLQCILIRFTPSIIPLHLPFPLIRTISTGFIVLFSFLFFKSPMIPLIRCDRKVCNISKLCIVSKLQLTESNWVFARKQGRVQDNEDEHWGERRILILVVGMIPCLIHCHKFTKYAENG